MLYIRNHKISELSVEFIATFQSKLLHLDVIYLPCAGRKSFREKLPWFDESKRTLSGYRVAELQHKLAYTGKCKLCLQYGRFKPRSSLRHSCNTSRMRCVDAVDAWGYVALASAD